MRKLGCVLLGLMVGLLAVPTAQAQTNINEVVGALKKTHVYVAPGAEGTNQDTPGELVAQLNGSDRLVLVMLPANGDDPETTARAIDRATGHKYIVGLSVGSELTAASTIMPDEVARDLMQRAVDTGTNPTERMVTFARNVHEWQADHPDEPASKETDKGGVSLVLIVILFVCGVAAILAVIAVFGRGREDEADQQVKFKASPGDVRDVLRKIQDLIPRVEDSRMRESARQAISDTEEYFRRSADSASRKHDADVFAAHLKSVRDVLTRYIDVQDYPRFYDDSEELMSKGLEAVNGFGEFVLRSIKAGRRSDLTQFNVDTDILSAQKYS
jgi:hypothetical protein